jgi:hypothetical protein
MGLAGQEGLVSGGNTGPQEKSNGLTQQQRERRVEGARLRRCQV